MQKKFDINKHLCYNIKGVFKMKKIIISLLVITLIIFKITYKPKTYNDSDFNIKTYTSKIDKDLDGVDDQTDMLKSVKEYIKTKPKYKSKYYNKGYPNDNYGVCTDVVAFGMLNTGYDLKTLVNEDIKNNYQNYNIDKIDINIDFRRVKNLQVYFKNNHLSLTTNIYDIDKWQAGDIVIFKNHIGVISNKRNKKGIPYVIHHYSIYQTNYEEDILEKRKVIYHFRIS